MANPTASASLLADEMSKPMITNQIATIADHAAPTAVATVMTWSANEPTAADTQTIADGTVPTVAELGQWVANANDTQTEIVADLTSLVAKVNAILVVLEDHGLVADS